MATHALIDASIVPCQGWIQAGESPAIQRIEKTLFHGKLCGVIQLSGGNKKLLVLNGTFKFNTQVR